jgi:hypothetical protein
MAARKSGTGSRKKSGGRKYGKAAGKSVESAVRREKKGTLRSGKGGKGGVVKSRKQAIAIELSEARKKAPKFRRSLARKYYGLTKTLRSVTLSVDDSVRKRILTHAVRQRRAKRRLKRPRG